MTPIPQHGTPAGDATIAVRRLARQSGADVQEIMILYALGTGRGSLGYRCCSRIWKVSLAPLLPTLAPMNERSQQKYRAWRIRSHREAELPTAFADVLSAVAKFADPVLSEEATGRWNPRLSIWE